MLYKIDNDSSTDSQRQVCALLCALHTVALSPCGKSGGAGDHVPKSWGGQSCPETREQRAGLIPPQTLSHHLLVEQRLVIRKASEQQRERCQVHGCAP